jgi:copper chaperone CopZ
VSRAIASVEGVNNVDINFEKKQATVKSTSCSAATVDAIKASLDKAGYGGKVVNTQPAS